MDIILFNGNIYTQNFFNKVAQAVGIKDGYIKVVGSNRKVFKYKGDHTQLIDLKGQTVLPGFNDSHLHLFATGRYLEWVNLSKLQSVTEIQEKFKEKLQEASSIIIGFGWNQDFFKDTNSFLSKSDLDQVTTKFPIIAFRACGHIATCNSLALKILGVDMNLNFPDGKIDFNTGIFYESAIEIINDEINNLTVEKIKESLAKIIKIANENGITSVQTDDFFNTTQGFMPFINAYHELEKEGKLTLRIYEQCLLSQLSYLLDFIDYYHKNNINTRMFKIGPLKLIADGSLGSRTAALSKEYVDDKDNCGILNYSDSELLTIIRHAHINNLQIAIHAIGDRSISQVISAYKRVLDMYPKKDHRHGIVHCQITNKKHLKDMKKLGLIAYIQPIFLDYDQQIVRNRVGEELEKTSYAFKSMVKKKIPIAIGTDSPIESLNPFHNIYCAITRKTLFGNTIPWLKKQALSLKEIIKYYTSSYSSFEEKIKGKIKKNFFADIIVLDKNIFKIAVEEIKSIKVKMTIVDGKIVYNNL